MLERRKELQAYKLSLLRPEPEANNPDSTTIAFRKPTGNQRIQRRFLKTDKIQMLYDFIDSQSLEEIGFEIHEDATDELSY